MKCVFWAKRKNKKGITLVEMVVAIAITAILAICLSTMLVPILNVYSSNRVKVELQEAVTARLNDIAMHLRGASSVHVTMEKKSFFDISDIDGAQYQGCLRYNVQYAFAMDNYYSSTYYYPELKCLDTRDEAKPSVVWASAKPFQEKLLSDEYQDRTISGHSYEDFFFYVRKDGKGRAVCLEIHLIAYKGDVMYEGTKTITCENLVTKGTVIYTAKFAWIGNTGNLKLTDATVGGKYYSVWFAKKL